MATNPRIAPIERATGRSWEEWLRFLDGIGARDLDHHEIATRVLNELEGAMDQPAWWAQSVTVAYEQDIGRRLPGQRPDGTFQMSVSKATSLGMAELMDRWQAFAAADDVVLALVAGTPKVSGTDRRITWRVKAGDGSSIVVTSEPKQNGTASLVAMQMGLPTLEANDEAREWWAGVVARFLERLG